MQPRPIACRRAVLPLTSASQHIWVSDELLAHTFGRFLRIRAHQTRHGSSTPGPLEARRRGAKRRMTAVASTQGSAPAPFPFSFGALFGSGSSSKGQVLRYEPPSIGTSRPVPHPPAPRPDQLPKTSNASSISQLPSSQKNPFSSAKFTALLSKFRALVARSASCEDIIKALSKFDLSRDEYKRFPEFAIDILRRKRWDLADILKFLADPHVHIPTLDSQESGVIFKHIVEVPLTGNVSKIEKHYSNFLAKVLEKNAVILEEKQRPGQNQAAWRAALLTFLSRILSSSEAAKLQSLGLPLGRQKLLANLMPSWNFKGDPTKYIAREVIESGKVVTLARPRAGDLACILGAIPPATLTAWLPSIIHHLQSQKRTETKLGKPAAVDNGAVERLLLIIRTMETEGSEPTEVLQLQIYDTLAAQILQPGNNTPSASLKPKELIRFLKESLPSTANRRVGLVGRITRQYAEHLARLSKSSASCQAVFEFLVKYLYENHHADHVIEFLRNLEANEANIPGGAKFLHQFILQVIDEENKFAFHLGHAISALQMSYDSEFPLKSIVEALETRHEFQDIIDSAAASRLLPPSLRDQPIDTLLKAQTVLIHQIAHQYSLDLTRGSRYLQRQLIYLYRFLRDRDLPIGPLFTKSIVRICIARPLAEGRWVSSRRVKGICDLIARVEGKEAARRVEEDFFNWRGELLTHAIRKYRDAGGTGLVSVSQMRKTGLI